MKLLEKCYELLKAGKNPYDLRKDFDLKTIKSASILTLKPKIIVLQYWGRKYQKWKRIH